jgi:hypothetical protein
MMLTLKELRKDDLRHKSLLSYALLEAKLCGGSDATCTANCDPNQSRYRSLFIRPHQRTVTVFHNDVLTGALISRLRFSIAHFPGNFTPPLSAS